MGKAQTELVFILDRSGSMHGYEADTIGGFNSMLRKQKKEGQEILVTTILFNHETEKLHDRLDIQSVEELTEDDYAVSGCTALLDAVGEGIDHIRSVHRYIRKEDVPEHTLFVITTDGLENASRQYSLEKVRKAIAQQKKKGWEFLFLAADLDAESTSESLGIGRKRAASFHKDRRGMEKAFDAVSCVCCALPSGDDISESWKKELDEDFRSRKKQRR